MNGLNVVDCLILLVVKWTLATFSRRYLDWECFYI